MKFRLLARTLLCFLLFPFLAAADTDVSSIKEMLGELVSADTTNPPGNEARAVKRIATRLQAAGIPFEVVEFAPGRANLVARLKGNGKEKPLMLIAHLDVVGTKGQSWTGDPHTLVEKDGYWYGRGVGDDLGMAVMELETFLALKRDNVPLRRDVILALTGDEESGGEGIRYLLDKKPALVDAAIALNEGGGLSLDGTGKMRMVALQMAEKIYQDYTLTATGTTGHSSVPVEDNAIYRLARALDRLSHYTPPNHLIPVTRAYFAHLAELEASDLKTAMRKLAASKGSLPKSALKRIESDPTLAAALHTTCVATLVEGGTRQNALPATASANVNCRILPDETIAQVRDRLRAVIHDPKVDLKLAGDMGIGGTSPAEGEVPSAVAEIAQAMWPGTPVIPTLSRGATDSRFLREKGILAYGINPIAMSEIDERRFHGIDERIPVASVKPGLEFFHKLVRRLAEAETKGASAAK